MKKFVIFVCMILILVVSITTPVSLAEEGKFITNLLSGKCIDVDGLPGASKGTKLQLWDCELSGKGSNGSTTDQKWTLTSDGFIKNVLSGKCIDVDGLPGTRNGAKLQLWDCELSGKGSDGSTTDQQWIWK